jgi:hypothetical protein
VAKPNVCGDIEWLTNRNRTNYMGYLLRRPFKKIKLVGNERKDLTAASSQISNFNLRTGILITDCMACGGGSYMGESGCKTL